MRNERVAMSRTAPRRYVIGVDLGGTKIRAGVLAGSGQLLARSEGPTPADDGELLLQELALIIDKVTSDAGIHSVEEIAATAVGAAGVLDHDTGALTFAPNLSGLDGIPFRSALEQRLGHPVHIVNDVNAAALGELYYGAGRDASSFAFIGIGTGVGMGLVIDGKVVTGSHGAAGEIGHLPLGGDPLDPANHRSGPLENTVSGPAVERRYAASTGRALSAREIYDAIPHDQVARDLVTEQARDLALAVCAITAVVDPEVLVLGGGVGSRPELAQGVREWLQRLGADSTRVVVSTAGDWGPVLGAAHAALDCQNRHGEGR